ncbi:MAG: transcriptional regulator, partial [Myxococcota bacterium]|nr:transcriptional regulator [Myxococcota bacterium]
VPYIKLVERERLRTPARDEEAVNAHYTSDEINRLFDELVGSKLVTSQILSLLGEGPRSTSQIAEHLELAPSEVSRHMKNTSRQGLVRFDVDQNRFVLA